MSTKDPEQRKKEKSKKKKKAAKEELKKVSKKRRAEEIEEHEEEQNETTQRQSSPSKRPRTEGPIIQIPDSQQPLLPVDSPFYGVTASIKVSVPPVAQSWPLEGVCATYLSPLLLTYHPELKGVIVAYNHARLSSQPTPATPDGEQDEEVETLAQAVDEYAAPFLWVTAHFLILRPEKGSWLAGHVNLQNESSIGIILWNLFSVNIEKKRLPKAWRWVEQNEENGDTTAGAEQDYAMKGQNETWGSWLDGNGDPVSNLLRFRVRDIDVAVPSAGNENGFMSVEGTLLSDEEEKTLEQEEKELLNGNSSASRVQRAGTSGPDIERGAQRSGVASSSRAR